MDGNVQKSSNSVKVCLCERGNFFKLIYKSILYIGEWRLLLVDKN